MELVTGNIQSEIWESVLFVNGYLSHLAIFVTILQIWPSSHQPIKVNGDKCIGPGMAIVQYHLRLILLNSNCSGRLWSGEHKIAIKIAGSDFYEKKVNTKNYWFWLLCQNLQYGKWCHADGQMVQERYKQGERKEGIILLAKKEWNGKRVSQSSHYMQSSSKKPGKDHQSNVVIPPTLCSAAVVH